MAGDLRLILFDCDGTLVDSARSIHDAIVEAWIALGLEPPPASVARKVIGLPLGHAIAALSPDEPPATQAELTRLYGESFARRRADGRLVESLYDGAQACVETLDEAGDVLGVATGKSLRGLRATLAHHGLSERFVTLQTSDLVPGKPRPDMAIRAMQASGADPARTVMIGDTTFDMLMARNAGIAAIGVAWGYHAVSELETAGAAAIVETFDALETAIDRIIGER